MNLSRPSTLLVLTAKLTVTVNKRSKNVDKGRIACRAVTEN